MVGSIQIIHANSDDYRVAHYGALDRLAEVTRLCLVRSATERAMLSGFTQWFARVGGRIHATRGDVDASTTADASPLAGSREPTKKHLHGTALVRAAGFSPSDSSRPAMQPSRRVLCRHPSISVR